MRWMMFAILIKYIVKCSLYGILGKLASIILKELNMIQEIFLGDSSLVLWETIMIFIYVFYLSNERKFVNLSRFHFSSHNNIYESNKGKPYISDIYLSYFSLSLQNGFISWLYSLAGTCDSYKIYWKIFFAHCKNVLLLFCEIFKLYIIQYYLEIHS